MTNVQRVYLVWKLNTQTIIIVDYNCINLYRLLGFVAINWCMIVTMNWLILVKFLLLN